RVVHRAVSAMMARLVRGRAWIAVACAAMILAGASETLHADISGRVIDGVDGQPIAGAVVSIRARPDVGSVVTDADGEYHLPLSGFPGVVEVGVAVPWN